MKSKEEWIEFQKRKLAKTQGTVSTIETNLKHPDYYYDKYVRQNTKDCRKNVKTSSDQVSSKPDPKPSNLDGHHKENDDEWFN